MIGVVPEQNTQIWAEKDLGQVLHTTSVNKAAFAGYYPGKGWPILVGVVPGIWVTTEGLDPDALTVI